MHFALATVPLAERKVSLHGLVLIRKLTSGVMLPVHPESGWAVVTMDATARASASLREAAPAVRRSGGWPLTDAVKGAVNDDLTEL